VGIRRTADRTLRNFVCADEASAHESATSLPSRISFPHSRAPGSRQATTPIWRDSCLPLCLARLPSLHVGNSYAFIDARQEMFDK
jgi:hypothetical protein